MKGLKTVPPDNGLHDALNPVQAASNQVDVVRVPACGERRTRSATDAASFTIRSHHETDPMGLVPMVKQVYG